ncbi:hypothetical protein ESFECK385B1_04505 [Escherichia fergusonii]
MPDVVKAPYPANKGNVFQIVAYPCQNRIRHLMPDAMLNNKLQTNASRRP